MVGLVAADVSASLPCISPAGSGAVPAPARARCRVDGGTGKSKK